MISGKGSQTRSFGSRANDCAVIRYTEHIIKYTIWQSKSISCKHCEDIEKYTRTSIWVNFDNESFSMNHYNLYIILHPKMTQGESSAQRTKLIEAGRFSVKHGLYILFK